MFTVYIAEVYSTAIRNTGVGVAFATNSLNIVENYKLNTLKQLKKAYMHTYKFIIIIV